MSEKKRVGVCVIFVTAEWNGEWPSLPGATALAKIVQDNVVETLKGHGAGVTFVRLDEFGGAPPGPATPPDPTPPPPATGPRLKALYRSNVRARPDAGAAILGTLEVGAEVEMLNIEGAWILHNGLKDAAGRAVEGWGKANQFAPV